MRIKTVNGKVEYIYARSDSFIVPPIGATVTYRGPVFGEEGSKTYRFAKVRAVITAVNATHGVMSPTVRLTSPQLGDAGCDVPCESLAETLRDDTAILREEEQTCACWLASHTAGHKDGTGESFEPHIERVLAKPGVDRARVERLAAAAVVTGKYVPFIPGLNDLQESAMRAEGLIA